MASNAPEKANTNTECRGQKVLLELEEHVFTSRVTD